MYRVEFENGAVVDVNLDNRCKVVNYINYNYTNEIKEIKTFEEK